MAVTNYLSLGNELIGERELGNSRRNFAVDALGSVTGTIQGSAIENTYAYKPFGEQIQKTGSASDPSFTWVGSGQYKTTRRRSSDVYIRARHYGTGSSRWTTRDPQWPGEPAFQYARANPTTKTDPSGLGDPFDNKSGTDCEGQLARNLRPFDQYKTDCEGDCNAAYALTMVGIMAICSLLKPNAAKVACIAAAGFVATEALIDCKLLCEWKLRCDVANAYASWCYCKDRKVHALCNMRAKRSCTTATDPCCRATKVMTCCLDHYGR